MRRAASASSWACSLGGFPRVQPATMGKRDNRVVGIRRGKRSSEAGTGRQANERKPSPIAAGLVAASHLGPRDPAPCGARAPCWSSASCSAGPRACRPAAVRAVSRRGPDPAQRDHGDGDGGWGAGMRALGYSRLQCPRKLVTSEPKFLPVGMGPP